MLKQSLLVIFCMYLIANVNSHHLELAAAASHPNQHHNYEYDSHRLMTETPMHLSTPAHLNSHYFYYYYAPYQHEPVYEYQCDPYYDPYCSFYSNIHYYHGNYYYGNNYEQIYPVQPYICDPNDADSYCGTLHGQYHEFQYL